MSLCNQSINSCINNFVSQTRKTAGWLAGKLSQDGHSVGVLSGNKDFSTIHLKLL